MTAKAKDDRITFRTGEVRRSKIAQYKENHRGRNGKELSNTDIMIHAIDLLLESEEACCMDRLREQIRSLENILIKIILGMNENDLSSQLEYYQRLERKVKEIKESFNR